MKAVSLRAVAAAAVVLNLPTLTVWAEVEFPSGIQDFEAMAVDDSIETIGWEIVNNPPESDFSILAADDFDGMSQPRGSSTRWVRISDNDGGAVQNRFYSPAIFAPAVESYQWTYHVNLETVPPGDGAVKPKFTIQHIDGVAFANAWGVEFTSSGANLIVLGIGGMAAATPLFPLASPTGLNEWVKITLRVNFGANTVSASANDGPFVSLPINLPVTADPKIFRLCYRGEGAGNTMTMLLDDPSVVVATGVPTVSQWGVLAMLLAVLSLGSIALLRNRGTVAS